MVQLERRSFRRLNHDLMGSSRGASEQRVLTGLAIQEPWRVARGCRERAGGSTPGGGARGVPPAPRARTRHGRDVILAGERIMLVVQIRLPATAKAGHFNANGIDFDS